MPKFAYGYAVDDLTQYRANQLLADGSATTGADYAKLNAAVSGLSAVLDLGATPPAASKLKAAMRYQNTLGIVWHHSSDGTTWTAASSSVTAGGTTDAALTAHTCAYSSVDCVTTLAGAGITARYWRVSVQDSDTANGSAWRCGGVRPSSKVGLAEVWAEDSNGNHLPEFQQILLAQETVYGDGATAQAGRG